MDNRCGSSGWRSPLLGQLQKNWIMEIRRILLAVLQQLQMPRPNLAVVTIYLPRDEAPFDRRFRELLEGRAPSRCHQEGEAVVRQPAVDRFHQIRAGLVEEQTVRAQDHVVQFLRNFSRSLAADRPTLCKNSIQFLGYGISSGVLKITQLSPRGMPKERGGETSVAIERGAKGIAG